jgi:copper chaperone CopZ
MKIEVLYFDGCPNHALARERVLEVMKEEGLSGEVSELSVHDDAAAQAARFLGSPSIRINGVDVEPAARASKDFGMMCRTYTEDGKRAGVPSREVIRAALREEAPTQLSEPVAPTRKWLLGASVAAAVGASLCCILPILTVVTGIGVLAAGAQFEVWRPYLLGVTGLLLGAGIVLAYRDHRKACAGGSLCAAKPLSRWNVIALGMLAALVAGLAAFPYYSGAVAQSVVGKPTPSNPVRAGALATVTFRVPDMDWPACTVSLSAKFQKLSGVADAKLDVDTRRAVVTYDPGAQSVASLEKVINDAGFHVASSEPRS